MTTMTATLTDRADHAIEVDADGGGREPASWTGTRGSNPRHDADREPTGDTMTTTWLTPEAIERVAKLCERAKDQYAADYIRSGKSDALGRVISRMTSICATAASGALAVTSSGFAESDRLVAAREAIELCGGLYPSRRIG